MNTINMIENYPKSSCNCDNYKNVMNKPYPYLLKNKPSNLSINNCEIDSLLNYQNNILFNSDIEPGNYQNKDTFLNPSVLTDNFSPDFKLVHSNDTYCPSNQYVSHCDPRLISVPLGGQVLTLDRPPFQTDTTMNELLTDKYDKYKTGFYNSYSDINIGDIMYYTNKSTEKPFYNPVFSKSTVVDKYLFKDPMSALKPQYERNSEQYNHLTQKKEKYNGCLSWIDDSIEQREDLISKQMTRRNRERWEPRWT